MISLQNVSKTYVMGRKASVPAVRDVSLEITDGEFVIITGRSGSGKTTLLNLMAGLTNPTAGQILLDGVAAWNLPDQEQALIRNTKIGFVFQFPSLMPALTALDNVLLPTMFFEHSESAGPPPHGGTGGRVRARQLLEEVGLADKLTAYPRQLSAGQQQRVVIARALINQPEVLLADEPTSDLDERTELEIMELFREVHLRKGVTIVMVTHSSELSRFGTRAIHMASGSIVEQSSGLPVALEGAL